MNYELFRTFVPVMTPLISFIITYHNEPEALLRACLESIRALPLAEEEGEIVVVDDGSEKPLEVDCQYVRQEQAGLSVARNTGIEAARGQYIQFVDADDLLTPAYKAVLEQLREQRSDIILFRMTKVLPQLQSCNDAEASNYYEASLLGGRLEGAYFLQHRNLRAAACGYAFRREILGELRFRPRLLHEDELFTPQLFLRAESLIELDVKAYFYRQHSGTITHACEPAKVQKRLDDIQFVISELQALDNQVLERRICQLTLDYAQRTWTLTHSFGELRQRVRKLRREGFLPLPLRCYSLRYLLGSLLLRAVQ